MMLQSGLTSRIISTKRTTKIEW